MSSTRYNRASILTIRRCPSIVLEEGSRYSLSSFQEILDRAVSILKHPDKKELSSELGLRNVLRLSVSAGGFHSST